MKDRINDINQDIDYMWKLTAKYPYLADNFQSVVDRLNSKKEELTELNNLEDLADYRGEDFNRIDKENDDLSVIKAKIQSQQAWIDSHK